MKESARMVDNSLPFGSEQSPSIAAKAGANNVPNPAIKHWALKFKTHYGDGYLFGNAATGNGDSRPWPK